MTEDSLAARLRAQRAATLVEEVEKVALRLFDERGFDNVTVAEIAATAQISARTFYGYFPTKEDLLQVRVDRRGVALKDALEARPSDELPLHSLRVAFTEMFAAEDQALLRQWVSVIASKPKLARGVLGGIQQQIHPVIIEFLRRRLDATDDALLASAYAATASGIVQASLAHWYAHGGDFPSLLSENLVVLERFETDPP